MADLNLIYAKKFPNLISSYSVIMEIGRGGQGTVFLVRRRSDEELFACKTVEAGSSASREIQFLRRMRGCSQVATLHQVIHEEHSCHLILELCDSNMRDRVKRLGALREREAARFLRDLATAVLALHDRGIVHRDLKLDNVLITAEAPPYAVKIGDLGMAANCTRGSTIETEFMTGTTKYLSPEATKGRYSEATDVWGLGIILYECLSGTAAFSKLRSNELVRYLSEGSDVTSRLDWSRVQPEAKEFILQMLQLDPRKRPSVSDIIQHPWIVSRCDGVATLKKRKLEAEQVCNDPQRPKKFKFQVDGFGTAQGGCCRSRSAVVKAFVQSHGMCFCKRFNCQLIQYSELHRNQIETGARSVSPTNTDERRISIFGIFLQLNFGILKAGLITKLLDVDLVFLHSPHTPSGSVHRSVSIALSRGKVPVQIDSSPGSKA